MELEREKPNNHNNLEFFTLGQIYITKRFSLLCKLWYLDFCILKHMINNKNAFENLISWVLEFIIARRIII